MARIDVLPSIDIIRGLKGILDFYLWKGLPCVRAWPTYRPARQTAASLATALIFGAIIKSYNLLANLPLAAYREDALDQPRTARDIMVTGVYGNLHEASMSDFLDLLTECRDFLSNLTALLDALHSIDTDELVVRTEHSVLPDGAATAAAQATQLTALQKIDDLQDALESKALDRLLVRGMDQLFSFAAPLQWVRTGVISGAGGYLDSQPVSAGRIWHITRVVSTNYDSATTAHQLVSFHNAVGQLLGTETAAFPAGGHSYHNCDIWLDPADYIRVTFTGGLIGDNCAIRLFGFSMTQET